MTSSTENELRQLLNAMRDDLITAAQAERLQALIAADDAALRLYVRYCALEAMLRERTAEPAADPVDAGGALPAAASRLAWDRLIEPATEQTLYGYRITDTREHDLQPSEVLSAAPPITGPPARRRVLLGWALRPRGIAALAACLLAAAVLTWSLARSPEVSAEVVSAAADAEWGAACPGGPRGTTLVPGTEVELRRGQADLRFGSGVTASVYAPARFGLTEAGGLRLAEGRVTADVPPSGVGFVVTTPTSTVVDLGTRFAVLAERGGATEVHVLKGRVRIEPGAPGSPAAPGVQPARELGGDVALRIEQGGMAVATVPLRPDRFRGAIELAFDVPEQHIGARGDDDGTYAEAGFKVTEASFTWLSIQGHRLQDAGWGGGFDLASTTPGRLFSLLSFEGKTRFGNPGGVTVYGYDETSPTPVTSQEFTLTGATTTYALDSSFAHVSRVVFRNESDPEFDTITVTDVPEPQGQGARPRRDPRRATLMTDRPYPPPLLPQPR